MPISKKEKQGYIDKFGKDQMILDHPKYKSLF